jgi:tripartite-type tricarboxylate transporter receptor subunit TctC
MLKACVAMEVLAMCAIVLPSASAYAQDFPNRPVRIVATGAGGAGDFAARAMAQGISGPLGQQVIVDNRPTNIIASEAVFKAPPDGYTLLRNGNNFWLGPLLQKTPYDPLADFIAITLTDESPNILVVHPSLPARSVKELIALAKARPGELNYGSGSTGGGAHLSGELLKFMANINVVRIPYKSTGPALIDLMAGQIQFMFPSPPAAPHVQAGRLRALAVTGAKPSALFPGLPTVGEAVPGYELVGLTAIFAPAKTPDTIIKRLNQEMVRYLHTPDARQKFITAGSDVLGTTPEEAAATIKADFTRMSKLIKDAGIRAD